MINKFIVQELDVLMTIGFLYDSRSWLDNNKTTAREDTIKEKQSL